MFRIKICGITRPEDARTAVEAGADAIGLNFYEQSKRYLPPEQRQDLKGIDGGLRVGVFVNAKTEELLDLANQCQLQAVQFHGDEPPADLATMPNSQLVIRARRMDASDLAAIAEDIALCKEAGRLPDAVLVDAFTPGSYGGTGETVNWAGLADYRNSLGEVPLILAGGLTPENVAEAIRTVQPHGVDTASGVEISPGVKCPDKMRSFIESARMAFQSIGVTA